MENSGKPLLKHAVTYSTFADGHGEKSREALLSEHLLELDVNGSVFSRIVCTRTELREMVVGRLCAERLTESMADIEELCFTEDETRVEVRVKSTPGRRELRRIEERPSWQSEWIFALARRFREGMPLHEKTFSTHCAFLMREGRILYTCEDVSRHNAADKAIGHALTDGVPLSECMLFTSGRVPRDMAEKAVSVGVPVLVSKSAATAEAVQFAESYGLTLLCRARENGFGFVGHLLDI